MHGKEFNFFALIEPDDDILPIRTVYDGVTQNIGNNHLTSKTPLWFAGCDVIASAIRRERENPLALFAQFASCRTENRLA